jgi:uncharacterized protein YndB with AHSA1/START domain
MADANKIPGAQTPPLVISRVFPAPPELVFRAWSSAEHLRHWFCPAAYTVADARVDFRVGGAFDICMRSPQGQDHWTRGHYTEIVPHSRLIIDMNAVAERDRVLFRAYTVVRFTEERGGTRLEVTQSYTLFDPAAAAMIQGAPIGWGQTLDRLAVEVARIRNAAGLES